MYVELGTGCHCCSGLVVSESGSCVLLRYHLKKTEENHQDEALALSHDIIT